MDPVYCQSCGIMETLEKESDLRRTYKSVEAGLFSLSQIVYLCFRENVDFLQQEKKNFL